MAKLPFNPSVVLVAVSGILLAAAGAAGAAAAEPGPKTFVALKCNLCHGVPAAGIEAKSDNPKVKGPDLPAAGEPRDAKWLKGFLERKIELEGKPHKKEFKGSDEELAALVDWLLELQQASAPAAGAPASPATGSAERR